MFHLRILTLTFTVFITSQLIGQNAERIALVDQYLEQSVADGIIPGGVFQVNIKGKEVYNRSIGNIGQSESRAYQEDDIFRIASMTKALTCVSIMQLYENGQLQIDDNVSKYIPAFAETKVYDAINEADSSYTHHELDRQITIRHLMTHTSGIYYGSFSQGPLRAIATKKGTMTYGLSDISKSTEQMVDHIATMPLAHQPGTRWTYGLNMEVLGRIVEVISGMTLEAYFEKYITGPLGMDDTHFYLPAEKEDRLVPLYAQLESGTFMNPDPNMQYPITGFKNHFAGGGGLSSTAPDYMRFIQTLVDGGTSADGVRILGRKTVDYMRAPQTLHLRPATSDHKRDVGSSFGLGFQVHTDESIGAVPFSPGTYLWGGYFNTKFWIDPVEKMTFVGMTQVVPFRHGEFWDKLYALIYSAVE